MMIQSHYQHKQPNIEAGLENHLDIQFHPNEDGHRNMPQKLL